MTTVESLARLAADSNVSFRMNDRGRMFVSYDHKVLVSEWTFE
jgi:hypothetical protein